MANNLTPGAALGLARSLLMYYAVPGRARAWRTFYRSFIQPGQLCFDIGAHVGNRSRALLGIGAQVVAVEPQPLFAATLQRLYGRHPRFRLVPQAVGDQSGQRDMWLSSRTPTVSTLSGNWATEVARHSNFKGITWDQRREVQVTTLDQLISDFGLPSFCKLDIEGYESMALRGLSQPISGLSFEFLPVTPERAYQALQRLEELGAYQYNYIQGEYPRLASHTWFSAAELRAILETMPPNTRAGEIYARLPAAGG